MRRDGRRSRLTWAMAVLLSAILLANWSSHAEPRPAPSKDRGPIRHLGTLPESPPTWGPYDPGFGAPVFAPDGTMYVADCANARIYRIDDAGHASVFAGAGAGGYVQWQFVQHLGWVSVGSYGGDGRRPSDAVFNCPVGLAFDPAGDLFIADHGNSRIREISADGFTSTVAGVGPGIVHAGPWTPGVGTDAGDGGSAVNAVLDGPWEIAFDGSGNLFIADRDHQAIRMIDTQGIITTVAGNGDSGYEDKNMGGCGAARFVAKESAGTLKHGDGLLSIEAVVNSPVGLALDSQGHLYICERGENKIRRVKLA